MFRNKKAAETVEYVIIMCLAVALGGALVSAVKSEPVQCKMKQVIEQSLPMEYSGDKSECGELAADVSQKNHHKEKNTNPTEEGDGGGGWFSKLKDTVSNGYEKAKQGVQHAWDETKKGAEHAWNKTKEYASDAWEWTKEHKEEIAAAAVVATGVVLLFVPGGQGIGIGMLIGAGLSGGISYASGNDLKTIAEDMAIGGTAGAIGGGAAGAIRTVGSAVGRRLAGIFVGDAVGGGLGVASDDALRGKKFSWKRTAAGAAAGVLLTSVMHGPVGDVAGKYAGKARDGIAQAICVFAEKPMPSQFATIYMAAGSGPKGCESSVASALGGSTDDAVKSAGTTAGKQTEVKYGEQYTRINRKKVLKSNVKYTDNKGYTYGTDSKGRISSAEGELDLETAKRNGYAQRKVGGEDRLSDDDGGHLIASIFGGSGNIDNLVPMNSNLNRGRWKAMENTWSSALHDGSKVKVKITPKYGGESNRPDEILVRYKIDDGIWETERYRNVQGG
ncbi:DNA/RNA non-specific endonuclease [Marininema halotolerans]|uniref:DNA/RNA non-specific endonuclease n=1 Tax=Marininema halotolerans TaxID=1155944 RepID=UPI001FECA5CE|nr:DNA/RNA non-specific endonuclease [Marininema halotolerans]